MNFFQRLNKRRAAKTPLRDVKALLARYKEEPIALIDAEVQISSALGRSRSEIAFELRFLASRVNIAVVEDSVSGGSVGATIGPWLTLGVDSYEALAGYTITPRPLQGSPEEFYREVFEKVLAIYRFNPLDALLLGGSLADALVLATDDLKVRALQGRPTGRAEMRELILSPFTLRLQQECEMHREHIAALTLHPNGAATL